MEETDAQSRPPSLAPREFATTRWSLVLAAGKSHAPQRAAALESLCETYWYPLYAYVRSQGRSHADAADLAQGFFASLLERNDWENLRPEKGRFRAFLLAGMKHYLINDWHHQRAAKRGGGVSIGTLEFDEAQSKFQHEPADHETPEVIFERAWANALLEQARAALRRRYEETGKSNLFQELHKYLAGDRGAEPYRESAAKLGISEGAAKVAVHRMRQRFRDALRNEIAHTVSDNAQIDEEIRDLFNALRG